VFLNIPDAAIVPEHHPSANHAKRAVILDDTNHHISEIFCCPVITKEAHHSIPAVDFHLAIICQPSNHLMPGIASDASVDDEMFVPQERAEVTEVRSMKVVLDLALREKLIARRYEGTKQRIMVMFLRRSEDKMV
jgi:hypothetical protein